MKINKWYLLLVNGKPFFYVHISKEEGSDVFIHPFYYDIECSFIGKLDIDNLTVHQPGVVTYKLIQ